MRVQDFEAKIVCLGFAFVAILALVLFFGTTDTFAAGGGIGNNGTFNIDGVLMQSNANTYGDQVNGSFSLSLDANKFSLDYANWSFYTDSYDTSRWTASCNLHGKRNVAEDCPQNQWWSQSYDTDKIEMSASLSMDCYDKYDSQISSLLSQIADYKNYVDNNPNAENIQEIKTQILLLQIQVATLSQKNEHVMNVYGGFWIKPGELEGSSFNWWNTTDYSYSYPNGYDQPPVITELPSWNADYRMYGEFVAPTLGEAQAMGLPFVQGNVPEPTSFVLMLGGIAVATLRRRQRARG